MAGQGQPTIAVLCGYREGAGALQECQGPGCHGGQLLRHHADARAGAAAGRGLGAGARRVV